MPEIIPTVAGCFNCGHHYVNHNACNCPTECKGGQGWIDQPDNLQAKEQSKWIALKDQIPLIGIEYLGYNPEWINEDYNPKGVRVWFHDDLGWYSSKYNNEQDCWDTTEEEKPTHWMELPVFDQPQEAKQPERTAEEMLRKHIGDDFIFPSYYSDEKILQFKDKIVQAMQEYSEQQCDHIRNLFSRPAEKLKPLQELYRKEHPKDGFYIPDATEFYTWIAEKVMKLEEMSTISDDEIEQKAEARQKECGGYEVDFIDGAKWAINKLKS